MKLCVVAIAVAVMVAAQDAVITAPSLIPGTVIPKGEPPESAPEVPEYVEPEYAPSTPTDEIPVRFDRVPPKRVHSLSAARARQAPKPSKPFHENGRHYTRRITKHQVLLSGIPDPWFEALMKVEPEDLTLDQVEDMTDEELIDYVGLFNWDHRPHTTNVVKVLRRREAIAQMKRRRRPGDEFEEYIPLPDTAGAHDIKKIGESRPYEDPEDEKDADGKPRRVPDEDRLMSYPRWHLAEEDHHIQNDPYYAQRRTERRRPTHYHHTLGKAKVVETIDRGTFGAQGTSSSSSSSSSSGAAGSVSLEQLPVKIKRAVIPTIDMAEISKVKEGDEAPIHHPKRKLSTVKRKPGVHRGTREERKAKRAQFRELPSDKRVELHHQSDPGRCYEAASDFCGGLFNNFAQFIDCTLKNLHKFAEHDEHCRVDYPHYYGPCAPDLLKHCSDLDSFESLKCLVRLAKGDAQALDHDGIEGSATERKLSGECLASESLEIMSESMAEQDNMWELSDKEKRMIYKYQEFWLSQQKENLNEEELRDYYENEVIVQVKEEHEEDFPDTGFGDSFDKDDEGL